MLVILLVLSGGAGWYARHRSRGETAVSNLLHILAIVTMIVILLRLVGSL